MILEHMRRGYEMSEKERDNPAMSDGDEDACQKGLR